MTSAILILKDPENSSRLMILSWWSSNLFCTIWGRAFPRLQKLWIQKRERRLIPDFGQRKFIWTLLGWLSVTNSCHSKLLSQSHYSTPLTWIVWIHGVFFPAFFSILVRFTDLVRPNS